MSAAAPSAGPRVGLLALKTSVPTCMVTQSRARRFAESFFAADFAREELAPLLEAFDHAEIGTRYLAAAPEWLERPRSFVEKNDLYAKAALELSRAAGEKAIECSGIDPEQIGAVVFASSTGIATPSLDALLVPKLCLPRTIARVPLWGLGCAGGVAALSRAVALARGLNQPVLVIACELCSLTFVQGDRRKANVIAVALFGDGAGAAVVAPEPWWDPGGGPELLQGLGLLFDRTEDLMGWDVEEDGLRVRFSPNIPSLVREQTANIAREAHRAAGLSEAEPFVHWVLHPGGRKVLDATEEALGLPHRAMRYSRGILWEYGNMSGPTVLFVLERFLREEARRKQPGLLMSFGPGFCAETVAFRW